MEFHSPICAKSTDFSVMLRAGIKVSIAATASAMGILYLSDPRASVHKNLLIPAMHMLDPEDAHRLAGLPRLVNFVSQFGLVRPLSH